MRTNQIVAMTTLVIAGASTLHLVDAQQPGVKRTELQRRDLGTPGHEAVQVRVDIDAGVVFPGHTHPGEEIIYVLEGTWEYEIAGKTVRAEAGDVLFVPAGAIHSARNAGAGNAAELATYIVEKGKPLLTLVD
jgi:quercetin dioxygenase-like cupin family protein